jgi:hypothetical protein
MKVKLTELISYVNVFLGETVCATYIMVPQSKVTTLLQDCYLHRPECFMSNRKMKREAQTETENF